MLTYQIAYALALSHLTAEFHLSGIPLDCMRHYEIHQGAVLMVEMVDNYWRLAERYLGR